MNRRNFLFWAGITATVAATTGTLLLFPWKDKKIRTCDLFTGDKVYNSSLKPYDKAPDFQLEDFNPNSERYGLYRGPQDFLGKIVVVNFFETWCEPCKKELPYFEDLYRRYSDDLTILAVNTDKETWDEEELHGLTFPIFKGPGKACADSLIIADEDRTLTFEKHQKYERMSEVVGNCFYQTGRQIPTTYVIDRKGIVRWYVNNAITGSELEKKIKEFL